MREPGCGLRQPVAHRQQRDDRRDSRPTPSAVNSVRPIRRIRLLAINSGIRDLHVTTIGTPGGGHGLRRDEKPAARGEQAVGEQRLGGLRIRRRRRPLAGERARSSAPRRSRSEPA